MLTSDTATQMALESGFDLVGFAPAGPTPGAQAFLDWMDAGYAGEMAYLGREPFKRLDPRHVLSGARTVMMVGVSYDTQVFPDALLVDPSRGRIARYAWGQDYHEVLTPRLRALGDRLATQSRAYIDTGPVIERAWAERCGLGFIGNNTCLIHRKRGSYFFLGAVFLAEEIVTEEVIGQKSEIRSQRTEARNGYEETQKVAVTRAGGHDVSPIASVGCGKCTRCLVVCPTGALVRPRVLDARRCISYLTIEQKGAIPVEYRPRLGNWLFGCDVCQDVCPYVRRYSLPTREQAFYPADIERAAPRLLDVLALDRAGFNAHYNGTPLVRAKRRGLLRNACVAAGNWGSREVLPALEALMADDEGLIREHAAWAITCIKEKE